MNDNDLAQGFADLAATMTDDPARLASVHRRIRRRRRRRNGLLGAAVAGVLAIAGIGYRVGPASVTVGSVGPAVTAPGTTAVPGPEFGVPAAGCDVVRQRASGFHSGWYSDEVVVARPPVGDELVFVVDFTDEDPLPPGFRSRELTVTITPKTRFVENRVLVERRPLVEGQKLVLHAHDNQDRHWFADRIGLNPETDPLTEREGEICREGFTFIPDTAGR
jgi:hypothetical protein